MNDLVDRLRDEYTSFRPVVCEDEPDAQTIWLDVGPQHFKVADVENTEHAEWFREMLAQALVKIIENEGNRDG